ncbi:hypothetical protein Bbelb_099540 [Branchiostoma belcheri]|nr:hypothetical protein Bbelb_099540 [Branchiostoma belcheri]
MGKRNRPSSGSSVSAEESSPSQRNPPPTKKMAAYKETDAQVSDLSPELQKLASVILQQTKQQQEAVGDRLSNQIQSLSAKVEALSTEVGTLREKVMQLEKAADFHAGEMTTLRDELRNETRERVKAVLLGERYSMKPDVIVRGIPYDRNEECSSVLANFLVDELHLDRIPTVAVHRLSKPTPSRPDPPLLARFVSYHDRDLCWRKEGNFEATNVDLRCMNISRHRFKPRGPNSCRTEMQKLIRRKTML